MPFMVFPELLRPVYSYTGMVPPLGVEVPKNLNNIAVLCQANDCKMNADPRSLLRLVRLPAYLLISIT
jgi:hypothetical protein